jgi:hypothetical protein
MGSRVRLDRLERTTNLVLLDARRQITLAEIGGTCAAARPSPSLRPAFERDKRSLREDNSPTSLFRFEGTVARSRCGPTSSLFGPHRVSDPPMFRPCLAAFSPLSPDRAAERIGMKYHQKSP